jgi:hypothetical protein
MNRLRLALTTYRELRAMSFSRRSALRIAWFTLRTGLTGPALTEWLDRR